MTRDFMADLETRVNAAAARIEELQRENRRLEQELAQNPLRDFLHHLRRRRVPLRQRSPRRSDRAEKAWTKRARRDPPPPRSARSPASKPCCPSLPAEPPHSR